MLWLHGCSQPQLMVQMGRLHVAAGHLGVLKFTFTQRRCFLDTSGEGSIPKCAGIKVSGKAPQQPQPLCRSVAGEVLWWVRWSL